MNSYDLVELVKEKQGTTGCSDRSFAMKNGFNYQSVIDWKSNKANANLANFIKLGRLAGLTMEELEEFAGKMEKRKNFKNAGFSNVVFLSALSASSISAMSLAKLSALPYEAIGAMVLGVNFVYYVKSNEYELHEIKGQLRTLSNHELLKFTPANDIESRQVSASCIH